MEVKIFKKLFEDNCEKLKIEKFKTSFFIESQETIIFLILLKSNLSRKYYLRIKTEIKPLTNDFDKSEFIKHDIAHILLSIENESPEIFDLENGLNDSERKAKMESFFENNIEKWLKVLTSKENIIKEFTQKNLFLLPYTKRTLGIE